MSQHLHREFVEWCFRCHLSRDEATFPEHACDGLDPDWAPCELCGVVHAFCSVCGEIQDDCEPS